MSELQRIATQTRLTPTQSLGRQLDIFQATLRDSRAIKLANFSSIETRDLKNMFYRYDEIFFDGQLDQTLSTMGSELSFRLSRRMTSAGGKTTRWLFPKALHRPPKFEIALSATLLFESFNNGQPLIVTGLSCDNRLQAMQRVMEHEIIHLTEMLIWYHSSCAAGRFLKIANHLFQHKKASHELLTPADKALTTLGIKVGDEVNFDISGITMVGFVNRITRRATVLVKNERGKSYTDGSRYLKFYVPLEQLRPAKVG